MPYQEVGLVAFDVSASGWHHEISKFDGF